MSLNVRINVAVRWIVGIELLYNKIVGRDTFPRCSTQNSSKELKQRTVEHHTDVIQ